MTGCRVLALVVAVANAACGFDSAGQGGSGTPQSSSSGAGDGGSTSAPSDTSVSGEAGPVSGSGGDTTAVASGTSGGDVDSTSTRGDAEAGTSTGPERPPELGPFGAPELVPMLNTFDSDDDPTLRADLLEIYFASLRAGGQGSEDIWRAERSSVDEDFGMPEPVVTLNAAGQDGWPELSHDGLVLTLGSDRPGYGGFDIWVSIRGTTAEGFPAPTLATDLSTYESEASAVFSADLLEAFVCSPVATFADLRVATRLDVGAQFGVSSPVATVNSAERDCVPFVDAEGTRVLFASDRIGSVGAMDLYTAVRATPDAGDAFEAPENLAALNSAWDDDDPWWAPDGSALYFSSARDGGDLDLWVAYRE